MKILNFSSEVIVIKVASKIGSWYKNKFVDKAKIKIKSKSSKK